MPVKRTKRVAAAASKKAASPLVLPECALRNGAKRCEGRLAIRKPLSREGKPKPIFVCAEHAKCMMCWKEVKDKQFEYDSRGLYCSALPGTKNRAEHMCAFQCNGCLSVRHTDNLTLFDDADEDLYCHSCVNTCDLCDNEDVPGQTLPHKNIFVCFDCKPLPNIRMVIVRNDPLPTQPIVRNN